MIRRRNFVRLSAASQSTRSLACMLLLIAISAFGCNKQPAHTSDPRLRKIDEMLNAEVPPGTPRARVEYFLHSRGYKLEDSPDKNSEVAVVRHIDTGTLQPSTARVTFRFDATNKLISYDLQSAPDAPPRP
jgi:hypothetical protein